MRGLLHPISFAHSSPREPNILFPPSSIHSRDFVTGTSGGKEKIQLRNRISGPSPAISKSLPKQQQQQQQQMCIYVQTMPLCGHPPPTLLSYASCTNVLAQLMRITEPEAWEPGNLDRIPFDLPDDCDPRPGGNILTLYSDDYCGWECRNNAYVLLHQLPQQQQQKQTGVLVGGMLPACVPGDEEEEAAAAAGSRFQVQGKRRPMVMGMPDARYGPGSERLGIGWRDY